MRDTAFGTAWLHESSKLILGGGRGQCTVVLQVTSRFDGLDRIRSSYRRFDDKISKVGVATRFFV